MDLAESKVDSKTVDAKESSEGKAAPANINVTRIDIDEGPAPLQSGLDFEVTFTTDAELRDAHWEIKYLVDSVYTRHVIRLLIATLVCDGQDIIDLNMVVQAQQQGGQLMRVIFNPLAGGDYQSMTK
eukprot:g5332.t1